MWLITPVGFFSIVRKPGDAGRGVLTVRARVRSDLEGLSKILPGLGTITKNGGTDYPFRAKVPREQLALAMADMVRGICYENFKNEVARRQGKARAAAYGQVWEVLHGLTPQPVTRRSSTEASAHADGQPRAYGGVVVDSQGRVLLRRPRGHFDGYVWTFPKGKADPGETPEQTAVREVREETGYSVSITGKIAGAFSSGSSATEYFLMSPDTAFGDFDKKETTEIRMVSFVEAATLMAMTTNPAGRKRDLEVLAAAMNLLSKTG